VRALLFAALLAITVACSAATGGGRVERDMFAEACELMEVPCRFERPIVVYARLEDGLEGTYLIGNSANALVISYGMRDHPRADAVIFHEMIHYLQWRYGLIEDPATSDATRDELRAALCEAEKQAFIISRLYAYRHGLDETEWSEIHEQYRCPA
jgi:hypothetical protein